MQRLLRGKLLYVGLGVLVLLLYARALPGRLPQAVDVDSSPVQESPQLAWWPKELTTSTVKEAAQQQPRLAIILAVLSTALTGLLVGGLLIALWALVTGRVKTLWRFVSPGISRWTFGELTRIVLLIAIIAGLMPFVHIAVLAVNPTGAANTHLWVSGSMLVLDLFLLLTIVTFASGAQGARRTFFPASAWPNALLVGLRGYLAAFPWLFLSLIVVVELARRFGFQPPIEPIQELVFNESHPGVLALTVVLACLVGPLAEELFFRGVLYGALRQRISPVAAMLISAALFSLIHTNVLGFIPIMLLGCLLAHVYERTGSLAGSLAIHILHNSLLMGLALVFRQLMASG